jgi:hypothetical protein
MTREIGPELVARIRHVADSLEAIANCDNDSPQPFIAATLRSLLERLK